MIDFKTEIAKYKPLLVLEEMENEMKPDEVRDVMDLLQYISNNMGQNK